MNGCEAMLHLLAEAGVPYLFGNPGTTELPLSDALVDHPRIKYILGLQEVPIVAIAEGYAQASRSPGVVNLHISCGLGNGMGMLYNAYRAGTPLIVTAGQQDRRLKFEEPILWSDMVRVARPWTKWAVEVERVEDLPLAIRRAVQTALMPPTGPVFLSIPVDVQREEAELDLSPPRLINPQIRPPESELRRAAELLVAAQNPGILVGSRVVEAGFQATGECGTRNSECGTGKPELRTPHSALHIPEARQGAVSELVEVAELIGAPVISELGTTHGRLSFPCTHPLSAPGLPLWAPEIRERLSEFDVLFVVGMDVFRLYVYFEPDRAVPEHVRLIHLDQNPWELGKNYPTEVALAGDPKVGLRELASLLRSMQSPEQKQAVCIRTEKRTETHAELRQTLLSQATAERHLRPITPLTIMESLARALPPDVAVIEEAVTTTNTYLERLGAICDPTGYFGHRGWALGWGLGCSIGVRLAWPDRPVLAVLGEGASLYGIQGLWTAAHYQIPVTFVICNNAQYQILKVGAQGMSLPRAQAGRFEGMDLTNPEVDMVLLARSFGVEAERITEPDLLTEKVRRSLAGNVPRLFDVPIQRTIPGKLDY